MLKKQAANIFEHFFPKIKIKIIVKKNNIKGILFPLKTIDKENMKNKIPIQIDI